MSVAIWPADLPKPLQRGYRATREDTRRRRLAAGPLGFTRGYSSSSALISLSIEVPLQLSSLFWEFFDVTTVQGSLPFRMPNPSADNARLLDANDQPILDGNGAPILLAADWLCLFGEEVPLERLEAGLYLIAFDVVRLP